MDKKNLIRVISGEATHDEEEEVLLWIRQDQAREDYFISLKNLWVAEHTDRGGAGEPELAEMRGRIADYERSRSRRTVRTLSFLSAAAGLLLLLSLAFNLRNIGRNNPEPVAESATGRVNILPDGGFTEIYTVKGAKARTILPDSTVVFLNSASRIKYPTRFTGGTREVWLDGEAYFEVKKMPDVPMVVATSAGFDVKVTGTKFNVRSYSGDRKFSAVLYEGAISLITKDKSGEVTETPVAPRQIVELGRTGQMLPRMAVADTRTLEDKAAWKDGRLVFDSTPIRDVFREMERWYGTRFIIHDESRLNNTLTATFSNESVIQVMDMIRYCTGIQYSINNNIVTIK